MRQNRAYYLQYVASNAKNYSLLHLFGALDMSLKNKHIFSLQLGLKPD